MKPLKHIFILLAAALCIGVSSCSKVIDITIPADAEQVVVEGTIETNVPPVVILTKSARFFDNIQINNLGSYFIHGAAIKITASDGQEVELIELCLQNLNLSPEDAQTVLSAFGFTSVDSGKVPDVCVYTVPDIATYFTSGQCSFMGKERTTYNLDIMAPGFKSSSDSIHVTSSTYIPKSIGVDSLGFKEHPNPAYRDSMISCYAYFSVPDTFGNFVRYWTKRNSERFYAPLSQSVYDDRLFVGLTIGLPVERGQPRSGDFDINTYSYFWKGDTITVKWGNIDNKVYDFYYTLENDGGDSPFSSPVKIKTNINNGLGVWAGYATQYSTIIAPK
ncbi:MAG: DUF4249 family protein [Chitinophagales bacterium]|nr:DUF4249 family protein [Chitinophagales bacterium]